MIIDTFARCLMNAAFLVPQYPAAALNECLVTLAHLPPTVRHHVGDVAVLGGVSHGLYVLLDLCWRLTASSA
jgi:hypothetical protein